MLSWILSLLDPPLKVPMQPNLRDVARRRLRRAARRRNHLTQPRP